MADTPTPTHTLDTTGTPKETTFLSPQSTEPAAQVTTDDGWEVEDTGRVRGDNFDSLVKAEQEVAARADGTDPSVLGDPDLPEPDLGDDDDLGQRRLNDGRDAGKPATTKPAESKGKLRLSKRVEQLRGKIGDETRTYRELQRGNLDIARKLLAQAEGREPAPRTDARTEGQPRRADGTFAAKARVDDPEPQVPAKPKRPVWEEYEAQDKDWAAYNRDLAKWDEDREAYLEAKAAHQAWTVRRDLGGEIAKRDERMSQMTQQTARERADAAFDARRNVVRQQIGDERWQQIHANWAEFDQSGYQSDALETLFKLHAQGPHAMAVLGENIEKAALLADREWTMPMFDGIMSLEDPTAVLLALADDPETFERIADLPASRAIAAIGALSGRLEAAGTRAHGSRPAKVSTAPAPIRPVGGRREGGTPRTGDAAFSEDAPLEDYIRDTNKRVYGRS